MKTILIVDYENDIRSLLKEELEELGYQALAVANNRDAIEILKNPSLAVNLLIIDPWPQTLCNWRDILLCIQESRLDFPVVIHTDKPTHLTKYYVSANDYIDKSGDLTKLINSVEKLIGKAS
jgi:DNA-binding NtrC family response regulator